MWNESSRGKALVFQISLLALVLGFSSPAALAAQEFAGQRWAVVIGVSEYEADGLTFPYADRDADEFYKFLSSPEGGAFPQDHLKKLTNKQVTLNSLRSALGTFLGQAEQNDYVVIYLSGHGLPDPRNTNNFYFLPSKADLNDLPGSAVEMREILRWVAEVPAKRKLLITDACHSGALGTAGPAKGPNQVNGFLRVLAQSFEGLVVLTSSEGYQLSQIYREKKHSYFTYFLLRALREEASQVDGSITGTRDGIVDPREVYEWVRKEVMKATQNQQIPDKGGDLGIKIPLAIVREEPKKRDKAVALLPGTGRMELKKAPPPTGADVTPPPPSPTPPPLFPFSSKKRPLPPLVPSTPTEVARARPFEIPSGLQKEIKGKDGAPMVLVPAGWFTMGSNDGQRDERPPHQVYLDAFYMDKFEVTTSLYGEFFATTGRQQPRYWSDVRLVSDGDRPVVGVSWDDADAYCRHYKKRLPTEAEWEKAARGMEGRAYPWGNDAPTGRHANFGKHHEWKGYNTLTKVGSFEEGKSPYGIHDLAGNVWEWVADGYGRNYYLHSPDRNPKGPNSGEFRVLRGGSWGNAPDDLRSAERLGLVPTTRYEILGFRCSQDAS